MSTAENLLQLLTGGLLGVTGQGLRVTVGIKKLNDQAQQANRNTKDMIVTSQLLISLLIGFLAGILATLSIATFGDGTPLNKQTMFSLLGAGYAGTDFIEAFMKKNVPDENAGQTFGIAPAKGATPQPGK